MDYGVWIADPMNREKKEERWRKGKRKARRGDVNKFRKDFGVAKHRSPHSHPVKAYG